MNVPIFIRPKMKARGAACVFFILVRSETRDVIEHERVHIRQQWGCGVIPFLIRYFGSKRWRADYEAEAYATSVKYGMPLHVAVDSLFKNYRTGLTQEQCRELIHRFLQ